MEAVSLKPHSSAWLPGMVSLKQDFPVVSDKGKREVEKRKGGREAKPCVRRACPKLSLKMRVGGDGIVELLIKGLRVLLEKCMDGRRPGSLRALAEVEPWQ